MKYIMMQYYKNRTKEAQSLIQEVGNQKTVLEAKKAFKSGKLVSLD